MELYCVRQGSLRSRGECINIPPPPPNLQVPRDQWNRIQFLSMATIWEFGDQCASINAPNGCSPALGGGGVWHEALVVVCFPLVAPTGLSPLNSPEGPPSPCVGPPVLFLHGGGLWHQHIKDPNGINLQL